MSYFKKNVVNIMVLLFSSLIRNGFMNGTSSCPLQRNLAFFAVKIKY
jgi:hypothetical protein